MSLLETRRHQLFPVLDAGQVELATRFASGAPRDFAPGEPLFEVGQRDAPAWLVLKGSIDIARRDGVHGDALITSHCAGQFSGEISQLAGRESLASGRAGADGCVALPFDAAHVRALLIGSAELGEIVMRAFILRRVGSSSLEEPVLFWSAIRLRPTSSVCKVSLAAMAIPAQSSTPSTIPTAAPCSSDLACCRTNCR